MSSRVAVRDPVSAGRNPVSDASRRVAGTQFKTDSQHGSRNRALQPDSWRPDMERDDLDFRATRRARVHTSSQRELYERARRQPPSRQRYPHEGTGDEVPGYARSGRAAAQRQVDDEPRLRIIPDGQVEANSSSTDLVAERSQSKCPPCHRGLFVLTLLLTVLSIPLVYSASTAIALDHYNHTDFFLTRQIFFVVIGLALLSVISRLPARHIRVLVWGLFAITVLGLLATKFSPLGYTLGGVRRWVKLGPLPLQFSELAKIALIGVLADFWSRYGRSAQKSNWPWFAAFGISLPVGVLVFVQPHLSAAALLFLLPFCIAFFAAVPWKQLMGVALVLMVLAGASTVFMKPYQRERLVAQFASQKTDERGSHYQALQGMRALQRGGLMGTGPGGGLFKQGHLPAPHTDFILAVTGEEWGLVGMLGLLAAYSLMIFFCFQTAHAAGKSFEALLCAGIGMLLAIQLICNVSVVTGLLPVTGMPLPLLSYGGSGLLCTLLGISLVLSVSRQAGSIAEAAENAQEMDTADDYARQPAVRPTMRQQPYLL